MLALDPAAVVLLIGTNDLEEGATPETIAGNMKLILAELKKHDAKMPIVLCQVFPSSASKKRPAEKIKAVNALYRAAVKDDPRVRYLETWPLFADAAGDAKKRVPGPAAPQRSRLREVGGGAAAGPRHARLPETEADTSSRRQASKASSTAATSPAGAIGRPRQRTGPARRWQASDPNAAAWPLVDDPAPSTASPRPRRTLPVKGGRLVVTTRRSTGGSSSSGRRASSPRTSS